MGNFSCPGCGTENAFGVAKCKCCGAPLGTAPFESTSTSSAARSECPGCGSNLAPGAVVCPVCRRSISDGTQLSQWQLEALSATAQPAPPVDPRAARRAQKLCQHCGGKFKGIFRKKCTVCGKKKDY